MKKEELLIEKWLFENEEALKSVRKGLLESAKGHIRDLGSFSKYIKEKQKSVKDLTDT
jgi:hypothetical protein